MFLLFSSVGEIYTSYCVMEQQVNTDIYNNQFNTVQHVLSGNDFKKLALLKLVYNCDMTELKKI